MTQGGFKGVFIQTLALLLGLYLTDAAAAGPLDQIIEGAKKEGTVTVRLRSSFTAQSMVRLEKEIKERFGVDLKVKFTPSQSMSKALAEAIMENKVGVPPSYDLMNFSNHVIEGMKAGVFERVDWKPLLIKGTNPDVVMDSPAFFGAITYYNAHTGLMYNTQKISPDRVPKTMAELADPKWRNKVGLNRGTDFWTRRAFILGKDKVLAELRAVLKNGAIQGQYSDLQSRYLLGEIWMANTITSYMKQANDKGMPTGWQSLDYSDIQNYSLTVRKGALHPNAAKLAALYLAGPEGARFTLEESNSGNLFYQGNFENDIRVQNKRQGIREVFIDKMPALVDFYASQDFLKLEKEIDMVLKTGGER